MYVSVIIPSLSLLLPLSKEYSGFGVRQAFESADAFYNGYADYRVVSIGILY